MIVRVSDRVSVEGWLRRRQAMSRMDRKLQVTLVGALSS